MGGQARFEPDEVKVQPRERRGRRPPRQGRSSTGPGLSLPPRQPDPDRRTPTAFRYRTAPATATAETSATTERRNAGNPHLENTGKWNTLLVLSHRKTRHGEYRDNAGLRKHPNGVSFVLASEIRNGIRHRPNVAVSRPRTYGCLAVTDGEAPGYHF
ncbi:hypothetical protein FHX42_004192 [Saccharopolyspora lacisalsi]|uniref:Uncharacterized protein n=1 Tax=Halosaccharopolyspora lacisalsi TaxID=1000566 RepID=A0A839E0J9_9PSEU|nr:hypothetical protein [Halosaccharopolyspora lacisalsi]